MDVDGVSMDLPSQYPASRCSSPSRRSGRSFFRLGLTEGTALATGVAAECVAARPMTHELFAQVLGLVHRRRHRRPPDRPGPGKLPGPSSISWHPGAERINCRPSRRVGAGRCACGARPILVDGDCWRPWRTSCPRRLRSVGLRRPPQWARHHRALAGWATPEAIRAWVFCAPSSEMRHQERDEHIVGQERGSSIGTKGNVIPVKGRIRTRRP